MTSVILDGVDTRLTDLAHSILTNLASGLEAAGVDVPDKRYVHSGQIAHDFAPGDCSEAFIVSWIGVLQGRGGQASTVVPGTPVICAVPLTTAYTVALLRCVPVLTDDAAPPTPEELDASATDILTDAMTLAALTVDEQLAGTLLDTFRCTLLGIGDVSPVGPLGGIGGCMMTLYVSLV